MEKGLSELHSIGRMEWRNLGQFYDGEWKDDVPEGQGTYCWMNPQQVSSAINIFKGSFRLVQYPFSFQLSTHRMSVHSRGKRNGPGVLYNNKGFILAGNWVDNQKEGPAQAIEEDGRRIDTVFSQDRPKPGWSASGQESRWSHIGDLLQGLDIAKRNLEIVDLSNVYQRYAGEGFPSCPLLTTGYSPDW